MYVAAYGIYKRIRMSVCSISLNQLKVIQSNLNITDISDSKCYQIDSNCKTELDIYLKSLQPPISQADTNVLNHYPQNKSYHLYFFLKFSIALREMVGVGGGRREQKEGKGGKKHQLVVPPNTFS